MHPAFSSCSRGAVSALLAVTLSSACGSATAQVSQNGSALQLSRLLNADGTLQRAVSYTGAIDAMGWEMTEGIDGTPRFVHGATPGNVASPLADTADIHWDSRFPGPPGIGVGTVYAVAMIGNDLYVGGEFSLTDKIGANNIARWNTVSQTWSPLGGGLNGSVFALAVLGSDLYAGGSFDEAGGNAANHIAKWNGTSWSTLGASPNDGVNSNVAALAVSGSNLFVGGIFTVAGGSTSVSRVALWNGTTWSALGRGVNGGVYALAVLGSDLYAGGDFTSADGGPAKGIARWMGTGWTTLGTYPQDGVNKTVLCLAAAPPYLYVGGTFDTVGGTVSANAVARWNGATWTPLGNGFAPALVRSLVAAGPAVYAGGSFESSGILTVNGVARWDTASSAWSNLNQGFDQAVNSLLFNAGFLYAGGDFTQFSNSTTPTAANHLAAWDGAAWHTIGESPGGGISGASILALALSGDDLYIGGAFTIAGSAVANHIVKYNRISNVFTPLGTGASNGVDAQVNAIAVKGPDDIYVGGAFTHAGGSPANHIAHWNGTSWGLLGTAQSNGTDGPVQAIALSGSNVFVGGSFSQAGSIGANYIAQWNGNAWSALGSGMNGSVLALAVVGSDLYAGGEFTSAGGTTVNYMARWNGTSWLPLGTPPNDGVNSYVFTLTSAGTNLYVGGWLSGAAGSSISTPGVAQWDGTGWSAMGNGLSTGQRTKSVYGLASSQGTIYATGDFQASGIVDVNNVAEWDPSGEGDWSPLGSGLSGTGNAIAADGDDVYVGGSFGTAGSKPSYDLAHWNPTMVSTSVGGKGAVPYDYSLDQNYPNPFNPTTTIRFSTGETGPVKLELFNVLGQLVSTIINGQLAPGFHEVTLDASRLSSGVYFYRLAAGRFVATRKLVVLK